MTILASIASEVQRSTERLDVDQAARQYWDQDEFLFLPQFLSPQAVSLLNEEVERLSPHLNRNFIPSHKKGGSVSYYTIARQESSLLELYYSKPLIDTLSRLVRRDLYLCPENDPHRCALYFYTEEGDHIGYHYDTSYYKGARYTLLIGLIQQSESRLLCRLYTRSLNKKPEDLAVVTHPGSMVFFNGDKVYHAVTPLWKGERRVILTMEYLTDARMGKSRKIFSDLKDAFAYFGFRDIFFKKSLKKT